MSNQNTSEPAADRPGDRDAQKGTAERWQHFDAKTDDEIAADVAADPDAARLPSPDRVSRAKRLALAKLVRQKLRMSRQAFAAAYDIPLETLNAWERHAAQPSPVEEAYLRLIEREPDAAKLIAVDK